jgi:hypothetical protein
MIISSCKGLMMAITIMMTIIIIITSNESNYTRRANYPTKTINLK